MKWLLLALGSMFMQQTFIALGKVLPAVVAPAIFDDLQIDPAWLGIYFAVSLHCSFWLPLWWSQHRVI
jgi:hypothetical protein